MSLQETDTGDALVKAFLPAYDVNLDTHEIDGNVPAVQPRHSDGVFLGGHDELGVSLFGFVYEVDYFLLAEPVMIRKPFPVHNITAEVSQKFLEAFRAGNAAQGRNFLALEVS